MKHAILSLLIGSMLSSCASQPYYDGGYYSEPEYGYGRPYQSRPYRLDYGYASHDEPRSESQSSGSSLIGVFGPLLLGAMIAGGSGGGNSHTDASSSPEAFVKANQNAEAAGRSAPNPEYGSH